MNLKLALVAFFKDVYTVERTLSQAGSYQILRSLQAFGEWLGY